MRIMSIMLHLLATILLSSAVSAQNANAASTRRLIGEDRESGRRWGVAATDLGIPYDQHNGEIGFLFGDTVSTKWVQEAKDLRSPVMLRSGIHPGEDGGIVFESAAGVDGDGLAPRLFYNGDRGDDGTGTGTWEFTVLPNDGISFPETGEHIISYLSIMNFTTPWTPNYSGLAYSTDGNTFTRLPTKWLNNDNNTDPFQMWTMQRDGDWVYVFTVRSAPQYGPLMLQRVPWDKMTNKTEYQGWGWNGEDWGWQRPCSPILDGYFGEPSVRRLHDGTWAMVYLNASTSTPHIVSRSAKDPTGPWSEEKVQVNQEGDGSLLYGGFIHPWSTSKGNQLYLMVSNWTSTSNLSQTTEAVADYEGTVSVSQFTGTL
uniref:Notoamide biosynthesis cluster protein J n=1 Tax=Aspergillus sp. (strain MF297-2) TaxID=877550 RepID=NOTJ_ASPSM|nr:RecName: Full=Notoamide biosynthesis cluster protein J; Flags: Precursor [Aspergillus sp. MF297-2]ADM34143.1 hypothetical protein [Aspergillus sp. MF297-2]